MVCGCGPGATVPPSSHAQPFTQVGASSPRTPRITGGSAAERALLAQIVRGMGTTQITKLTVSPATHDWHPLKRGDVELTAALAPSAHGRENALGIWEAWVVGGAFRDRSVTLGLPRVIVVESADGGSRIWPPGPKVLPPAPSSGLAAFRGRVLQALRGVNARVVGVSVGVPDGYSAAVTLQAADPVAFLKHQLDPLQGRLEKLQADGTFVQVFERSGRLLYNAGGSARISAGLEGVPDRRYATCTEVGHGGPLSLAPPLPCPSDWRPPPTTPVKLLEADGVAVGGAAVRGSGSDGSTIDYRPGTTIGIGFVLSNPNGHSVTVTGIAPAVGPDDPIAYTGARIQIPPSREKPGDAAELKAPYDPTPPFRPFSIAPGDWVGIGLHYFIRSACTPATAGTRITENRTVRITYTLNGSTVSHAYPIQALTMQLPDPCP